MAMPYLLSKLSSSERLDAPLYGLADDKAKHDKLFVSGHHCPTSVWIIQESTQ